MKNILTICALMAATAMSAQSLEQALPPKELKAKQKAELAEFKAKQKADLAAFIEKQKNPAAVSETATSTTAPKAEDVVKMLEKPVLDSAADSIAYLYGAYSSNGLKDHITKKLGVDPAYMDDFYRGAFSSFDSDVFAPETKAFNAGLNIGSNITRLATDMNKDFYPNSEDGKEAISPTVIAKSLFAAINGTNEFKPDDAHRLFAEVSERRKAELNEELYGENRRAGEKFLEENKNKEGVVTLPSGLQYKILTKGTGAIPKASDNVKVNYEGHLIDGTEFDSSYKRGSATFRASNLIKGWTEALTLMPVGSKWEIYIPYKLGYGERGSGDKIKPFSALVFTLELLSIEEKTTKK